MSQCLHKVGYESPVELAVKPIAQVTCPVIRAVNYQEYISHNLYKYTGRRRTFASIKANFLFNDFIFIIRLKYYSMIKGQVLNIPLIMNTRFLCLKSRPEAIRKSFKALLSLQVALIRTHTQIFT